MDLLALRYFLLAAKYGNFTKAARIAYTTQPNISKQMAQLEEEVGTPLFKRTTAGVILTPAGEYFRTGLSGILPKLEMLVGETGALGKKSGGILRLGLGDSMNLEQILPAFLTTLFGSSDLSGSIQISAGPAGELPGKLLSEDLDCILCFSSHEIDHPDLCRLPLNRGYQKIYYTDRCPVHQKNESEQGPDAQDFRDIPFVTTAGAGSAFRPENLLPFAPKQVIEADSVNAAFAYIESGRYAGIFGPSQIWLNKSGMHTLDLPDAEPVGTDLIWLKTNRRPVLSSFIELVKSHIQKPAYYETGVFL